MAKKETGFASNIFGLFKRKTKTKTSAKSKGQTNKVLKSDFRAVKIVPATVACEAAKLLADTVYLTREAPLLPLTDCSNSTTCACKYKHLQDRRSQLRRDSDNGLPEKFVDDERRMTRDRRRGEVDVWSSAK